MAQRISPPCRPFAAGQLGPCRSSMSFSNSGAHWRRHQASTFGTRDVTDRTAAPADRNKGRRLASGSRVSSPGQFGETLLPRPEVRLDQLSVAAGYCAKTAGTRGSLARRSAPWRAPAITPRQLRSGSPVSPRGPFREPS